MKLTSYTRAFLVHGGSREEIDEQTDQIMDELVELEDDYLLDSSVAVDLDERLVEITVTVGGVEDYDEAVALADTKIRTALHASGGSTPIWPKSFDPIRTQASAIGDTPISA